MRGAEFLQQREASLPKETISWKNSDLSLLECAEDLLADAGIAASKRGHFGVAGTTQVLGGSVRVASISDLVGARAAPPSAGWLRAVPSHFAGDIRGRGFPSSSFATMCWVRNETGGIIS
jgi:hypothetical protein